jgi:hypothetical protein
MDVASSASQLVIAQTPTANQTSTAAFTPYFSVQLYDAYGHLIISDSSTIVTATITQDSTNSLVLTGMPH